MTMRFTDDNFSSTFLPTIGIDFKIRTINLDGKVVKLQIWDTAGQERFNGIATSYYRGAMSIFKGILFVYDITSQKTFINIKTWVRNVGEHTNLDVERILVGNKCDLDDKRDVPKERGEKLALEYGMKFLETSAKTNENIENAFLTLARDIKVKKGETSKIDSKLSQTNETSKTGCCS